MLDYNALLRLGIHLAIIASMFACMTAVLKTMLVSSHKGMWSIVGSVIVAMCMQVFTAALLALLLVRRR